MKNRIILLLISLMMFSCSTESTEKQTAGDDTDEHRIVLTEAQFKSAGIVTAAAEQVTMSTVLKLNGMVEAPPQNMVTVSAPLGGYVRFTRLLPGMKIKKGEVLALLEDQRYIQLQQDFLTAKANLVYSEKEYQRQTDLNESKSSSDKVFQQAETAFTTQRVLLASLGEQLKLIGIDPGRLDESSLSRSVNLYSPVNGFVSRVNVNVGKYAEPKDVLFELIDPDDIHLALTVFEKDIGKLKIGQKVKAYNNNEPGKIYPCEIILVGGALSDERSLVVHCHFSDYDPSLLPGMYMNADITIESEKVYALEEEAIVNYRGKNYVFLDIGQGTYEMLEVQTGTNQDGFTEIKNALDFGDRKVVTVGAYTLLMSLKNKADE